MKALIIFVLAIGLYQIIKNVDLKKIFKVNSSSKIWIDINKGGDKNDSRGH